MKTTYQAPRVWAIGISMCHGLLAGSTGNAVSENGNQVTLGGVRTNGNASNAAARGGSIWDDEEESW